MLVLIALLSHDRAITGPDDVGAALNWLALLVKRQHGPAISLKALESAMSCELERLAICGSTSLTVPNNVLINVLCEWLCRRFVSFNFNAKCILEWMMNASDKDALKVWKKERSKCLKKIDHVKKPNSNRFQPKSNGLHSKSDGLHPKNV